MGLCDITVPPLCMSEIFYHTFLRRNEKESTRVVHPTAGKAFQILRMPFRSLIVRHSLKLEGNSKTSEGRAGRRDSLGKHWLSRPPAPQAFPGSGDERAPDALHG